MMKLAMVKLFGTLLLVLISVLSFSKEPPPAPSQYRWVQDEVGLLSEEQEVYLLKKLKAYYDSTSTEIAVVIEKSLEGDDVFRYSHALAEKWGIGTDGKDNGVLIYIAYENNDPALREIYIQVGYGLEGAIPDVYAKRIISQIMAPKFKEGKYGEGINNAIDVIIALAAGEYAFDKDSGGKGIPVWVIVLIVIILIIMFSKNNNGGTTFRGRGLNTGPVWMGGFGGGSGGGSFGGGGAGGSW